MLNTQQPHASRTSTNVRTASGRMVTAGDGLHWSAQRKSTYGDCRRVLKVPADQRSQVHWRNSRPYQLEDIFSTFGIPQVLKSDNGPPFNGQEFAKFCTFFGIKHRKVTPLWPQANGQVENFMRNVNKIVRNSERTGKSWKPEAFRFLRTRQQVCLQVTYYLRTVTLPDCQNGPRTLLSKKAKRE